MNAIGKSKQVRYLSGQIVAPLGYVRHKIPLQVSNDINKYTVEGRKAIHKQINHIDTNILKQLMENPNPKANIEYNDNLLSLYSAQKGKCKICGQELELEEIYCHHIIPKELGGTDEYKNLIIVHTDIHKAIHSTDENEVTKIISNFSLNISQIEKLNKFRKKLQLTLV
jgi:5-methylcytosine-specific restriction endonuclease McrA